MVVSSIVIFPTYLPTYLPTSKPLAFPCLLTTNYRMQLSMLGGSLVFMIIPGSKYEIVLKDSIKFFLFFLFSYFQNLGRVSKICKKEFHLGFKLLIFKHVIPINFQSQFLHINYHKIYYLRN
jgi:hypothetical protein